MDTVQPSVASSEALSAASVRGLAILRELAIGGLASLVAGVVVIGIGSRVFMRIAALLDPSAIGQFTAGGNRIGDITLAGSLALLTFVGLFGSIAGAVLWGIVQPWLPRAGLARIAAAAVVAIALGLRTGLDGDPEDFDIVSPAWASVGMLVVLVGTFGAAVAVLDARLRRRLPIAERIGGIAFAYIAFCLLGLLFVVPILTPYFSFEFTVGPSRLAWVGIAIVAAGLATVGWWAIRVRTGTGAPPTWLAGTGRAAVVAIAVLGLLHAGWSAARLLDLR